MDRRAQPKSEPRFKPPYIREWRLSKGMSLEVLAGRVPMDKGNLSKVERGLLPYNQEMVERIADVLMTDVASLIGRNPNKEGKVVSMIERLSPADLVQAERVLSAMFPTAANG